MANKLKSFNFSLSGASKQQQQVQNGIKSTVKTITSQSVLSINVNNVESSAFENQCMQQQQVSKKKRNALENLTNNGKNALPLNPTDAKPKVKKSDSLNSKKAQSSSSKENQFKKPQSDVKQKQALKLQQQPQQQQQQQQQQPKLMTDKKLSKSTQSIPAQLSREERGQILEPQIQFADSVEKLHSSQSSLANISHSSQQQNVSDDQEMKIQLDPEQIEGWSDIDIDDKKDEFSCSDYATQIFKYYREREARFCVDDYLRHQPSLNRQMRLLLVDWMVEVQQQLEFNHEVLYLSVKLLDLYLNKRRIEKERLQLLGGAAMFIACKFEERMPPIIDDFIYVSDNAYDRNELIKMEIEILKTIKFDIGIPLSYTFLRRYSKCIRADMRFLTLARYILELSLQDYNFAYQRDSDKACAALYLALKMTCEYENSVNKMLESDPECGLEQLTVSTQNLTATEWNPTLIHYTGCFLADFVDMLPAMNTLVRTAALSRYKTIYKKYSHQVFYEVAKIPPLSDQDLELLTSRARNAQFHIQRA